MIFLFLILILFAIVVDICCCISSAKVSQTEFESSNEFLNNKTI